MPFQIDLPITSIVAMGAFVLLIFFVDLGMRQQITFLKSSVVALIAFVNSVFVMDKHVPFESTNVFAPVVTEVAGEGHIVRIGHLVLLLVFFVLVDGLVSLQMAFPFGRVVAVLAGERILFGMDHLVSLHVALEMAAVVAVIASVRLVAGMSSSVSRQVSF